MPRHLKRLAIWVRLGLLLALILLSLWASWHPCILYAHGYSKHYILAPLKQNKLVPGTQPGLAGALESLGHVFDKSYSRLNWDRDGEWLYVEGVGDVEGKPWAPKGSFVIAALPAGIGFGTWDGTIYEQMEGPSILLYFVFWILAAFLLFADRCYQCAHSIFRFYLQRSRNGAGRCASCGYDLTGNISGTCPECGTRI